ncbi:MAG: SH3 domain-containing protein [Bacteroidota bacterium]
MSKAKKGLLPRVELLIVGIFFLSFSLWAISKCSATKSLYQEQDLVEAEEAAAEDTISAPAAPAQATNPAAGPPANNPAAPGSAANPPNPNTSANTPGNNRAGANTATPNAGSRLYVTIDGLNMRATPELNGTVLTQLSLYEEVTFMNEVTDSTQEINLGKEVANEPWVKVRNTKGKTGWVYGAGVHYYKMKHPGTIE